ncbi:MAG TPA: VOC family protein [Stellaceae bacterium]|nr:VOC family protein [Stellaceae bacterium]
MVRLPALDHAVIAVRDRMDEAVEIYRGLGFFLTPRGHHTLGSINHLAMFGDSYLELIGFEPGAETVRAEIRDAPLGFNALVLGTDDAEATRKELNDRGVAADAPLDFSRPVAIKGRKRNARFRTLRPSEPAPFGRFYFCEHRTRELVWRDEWMRHENGARTITRAVIASAEPRVSARYFARMFGAGAVRTAEGGYSLTLPNARIDMIEAEFLKRRYGDALPDAGGRGDHLALLTIAAGSASRIVPAAQAMNACLEFETP